MAAGHAQPVLDIGGDFVALQGAEVVAGDDALRQLPQFRPRQLVAQFRLSQQDDVQQLALVRFQIGQQPHLL
ncbi:hypothetical protein D3C85_1001480 [compost metagenome]